MGADGSWITELPYTVVVIYSLLVGVIESCVFVKSDAAAIWQWLGRAQQAQVHGSVNVGSRWTSWKSWSAGKFCHRRESASLNWLLSVFHFCLFAFLFMVMVSESLCERIIVSHPSGVKWSIRIRIRMRSGRWFSTLDGDGKGIWPKNIALVISYEMWQLEKGTQFAATCHLYILNAVRCLYICL